MAKTYNRSRQTTPVTIEGKRTKLALSLKDRQPLMYWYFIQHPCGGWVEFDVRDIPQLKERVASDEFTGLAGTTAILSPLATLLEAHAVPFSQLKYKTQ